MFLLLKYIYYLSVECLESFFDLLSLSIGPSCQHVDDGLLVRTESFHGCSKDGCVGFGIEIGCRADRGSALHKKHKQNNNNNKSRDIFKTHALYHYNYWEYVWVLFTKLNRRFFSVSK
jgi:hypothetical protein